MKNETLTTHELGNNANLLLCTEALPQQKYEPCIIQSAFLFENGRRIIIYTCSLGITSYECDENWNTF